MRVGLVCGDDPACAASRYAARPAVVARAVTLGYLVPAAPFDATAHGVYRSACNFLHRDTLLVVGALSLPDGPTTVRLDAPSSIDFRAWLRPGEAITRRGAWLVSGNLRIDLAHARTWIRPAATPYATAPLDLAHRLRRAVARLDAKRTHCASVLHRQGAAGCRDLEHACRSLEVAAAEAQVACLIGWGEGLTPAGDDFIVGLLAALKAGAGDDARRAFLRRLCATIDEAAASTTAVAAHYLRLAVHDHFNADVHALRDALLDDSGGARLDDSLDAVLSRGATSGGDLLAGLLAGIRAWVASCVPQSTQTS